MVKKIFSLLALITFTTSLSATATTEKKFVILVTSFNNAEWCVKNLEMLFKQANPDNTGLYQNYRIIVVDDGSYDGNAEYIQQYVYASNQQHRVIIIKNKIRQRALANIYMALQLCQPDEIVFNHDGDDWLADDQVFNLINSIYQNPEVWITYGSFINWPTNQMGYCKPFPTEYVEKQLFRKKWWMPGQLRTFYAWLFHQVQLKDLFFEGPYFQGQFFPANSDLAIYYPMMEMAGFHYQFIPEVIYIRNVETPLNDFKANKDVQVLGSKLIREKQPYTLLKSPQSDYFESFKNRSADILFFSTNPAQAQQFITSSERLTRNIKTITVLYQSQNQKIHDEYQKLTGKTITVSAKQATAQDYKNALLQTLEQCGDYILFAHDGIVFNHYFDAAQSIFSLERAFAYGFYLSLDAQSAYSHQTGMPQPLPPLNYIKDDIFAWAFHYADSGDWRCYNNLACTLYRNATVKEQIALVEFSNQHELFTQWRTAPIALEQVGLCYEQAKVGYINWH